MEEKLLECITYFQQQHLWNNAIFFSERYYAEKISIGDASSCEQALHVLATVYYRSGKVNKAYSLLLHAASNLNINVTTANNFPTNQISAENRYLFALCCYELDKLKEAESALVNRGNGTCGGSQFVDDFGEALDKVPNGAAGCYLLGQVCK